MRLFLFLLLAAVVPSFATVNLVAVAGYSGSYLTNAVMPVAITVINNGSDVNGEFILSQGPLQHETRVCKDFYFPAVIPANSKQLRFIYCNPKEIQGAFKLSFVSKGETAASTMVAARPFSSNERFILSAGGHGLDFMNGNAFDPTKSYSLKKAAKGRKKPAPMHPLDARFPEVLLPAEYINVAIGQDSSSYNYSYNNNNMSILTGSVEPNMLPDNADGYRGAAILYLPSNVTENSFNSPKVKEAIIGWISNGGCLLIGNGGVPGRLDTPFFREILPENGKKVKLIGLGKVALLDFDPEVNTSLQQKSTLKGICYAFKKSQFFTYQLANNLDMMPTKVKPPSISAIIMYLIIYILVVSPVNYLVLKKIDKRELAWKTTPIIAVLFTLVAFTIGLMSKGLNLYINSVSIVHSTTGQKTAEMNSVLSVYSPASKSYKIDLGDNGLYGYGDYYSEFDDYNYYNYRYNRGNQETTKAIKYVFQNSVFSIDDFRMDMWSQRKLYFNSQVSLGKGITAKKLPDGNYKITNGSTMDIDRGVVCVNAAPDTFFVVKAGKSAVSKNRGAVSNIQNKDLKKSYDDVSKLIPEFLSNAGTGTKLVCFSTNGNPDIKVSGKGPTSALTVLILNVD